MKKSRFTDEQIINVLKQAEGGVRVKELCREHGFSDATFYKWRGRLGGMDVAEAQHPRQRQLVQMPRWHWDLPQLRVHHK